MKKRKSNLVMLLCGAVLVVGSGMIARATAPQLTIERTNSAEAVQTGANPAAKTQAKDDISENKARRARFSEAGLGRAQSIAVVPSKYNAWALENMHRKDAAILVTLTDPLLAERQKRQYYTELILRAGQKGGCSSESVSPLGYELSKMTTSTLSYEPSEAEKRKYDNEFMRQVGILNQRVKTDQSEQLWPYQVNGASGLSGGLNSFGEDMEFVRIAEIKQNAVIESTEFVAADEFTLQPGRDYAVLLSYHYYDRSNLEGNDSSSKELDGNIEALAMLPEFLDQGASDYILGSFTDRRSDTGLGFDALEVRSESPLRIEFASEKVTCLASSQSDYIDTQNWSSLYNDLLARSTSLTLGDTEDVGAILFTIHTTSANDAKKENIDQSSVGSSTSPTELPAEEPAEASPSASSAIDATKDPSKAPSTSARVEKLAEESTGGINIIFVALGAIVIMSLIAAGMKYATRESDQGIDLGEAYDRSLERKAKEAERKKEKK